LHKERISHICFLNSIRIIIIIIIEGKEQCRVEISNRFAVVKNLDDDVDINRAWEPIRDDIKIPAKACLGYYDLKKHKPWFDKGCSKLLDQREQA
jgi:hypothetical protein